MAPPDGTWTRRKLLIWGKTYPEFSKAYYETVCTGAVDAETGRLVRIYPISLRYLETQFKVYNWIEADIQRNQSDFRPESFRIQQGSITVGEQIDTQKGKWTERKKWVLGPGNVFKSVEGLQQAEAQNHTSLGLIKPREITKVYAKWKPESEKLEWEEHRRLALQQKELFVDLDTKTKDLMYMPLQYRVRFRCDDPACTTEHDLGILDWGVYVLNLKEFGRRGSGRAEESVIAKLRECLDLSKKDAHLFLGNTKAHCHQFSIVGLFYPGKVAEATKKKPSPQTSLPGF